jgi:type II secretory ATPase GspE/PulE/Tfp pilus assembly ATPase PilB-like protein
MKERSMEDLPAFVKGVVTTAQLVDSLIVDAFGKHSSDIHIDPHKEGLLVRYRIDGLLEKAFLLTRTRQDEVISRIKLLSGVRIDEHFRPQDGRFTFSSEGVMLDIRATFGKSLNGEYIVLRLLGKKLHGDSLCVLGFSQKQIELINRQLARLSGLIVVAGPTGSGKTTTLYTLLTQLVDSTRSMISIEDPIEYELAGVRQIQVQNSLGLDFASNLRSVLRQDPDVIMVGEIRDEETARIAVHAGLTGHLVLTTLHAESAGAIIPRLFDMGVPPYILASTLRLALSQRLVRKHCSGCRYEVGVSSEYHELMEKLGLAKRDFYHKTKGCDLCRGTGIAGRMVISELIPITEVEQHMITERRSQRDFTNQIVRTTGTSFINDGIEKVHAGDVDFDECIRVIYET